MWPRGGGCLGEGIVPKEEWHRSRGVGGKRHVHNIQAMRERGNWHLGGGRILGIIDIFMRRVTLY